MFVAGYVLMCVWACGGCALAGYILAYVWACGGVCVQFAKNRDLCQVSSLITYHLLLFH